MTSFPRRPRLVSSLRLAFEPRQNWDPWEATASNRVGGDAGCDARDGVVCFQGEGVSTKAP